MQKNTLKTDLAQDLAAPDSPTSPEATSRPRRRRAFTLTEMMITVFLISLIFIATMNLFTRAGSSILRVRAGVNSNQTAGTAYNRVAALLREAALPGGGSKGNRPSIKAYKTTPSAQASVERPSYGWPSKISGAA